MFKKCCERRRGQVLNPYKVIIQVLELILRRFIKATYIAHDLLT